MNITSFVAALLAGLSGNRFLTWIPGALSLLEKIAVSLKGNEAKIAEALPKDFTAQQGLDAVFAFLELEFPAATVLLKIFQSIADALFTIPPTVVPVARLIAAPKG